MQVDTWPLSRIKPYPKNARNIPQSAIDKVAASLREYGWRQPMVIEADGTLIVGHVRFAAAQQLGWAEGPVHIASDLTPAQIKAYRLMDNRSHDEATWNFELLGPELIDLKALDFDLKLTGFEMGEIRQATASKGLTDPDEVPEVPAEPVTRLGDLWMMGEHRLLCGDSRRNITEVVGTRTIDLVLTDPPYGIGVEYGECKDEPLEVAELMRDVLPLLRSYAVVLLTSGHRIMFTYPKPDWVLSWVHPAGNGRCPWGFLQMNPILAYGKDPYLQAGMGSRPDCLVLAADRKGVSGHPTPKPLAVWKWLLQRGSVAIGQNILDPFIGSGTTIMACEETQRNAFGLELEPRYVDVAVTRWQNFTGREATLEGDGRTFAQVAAERQAVAA